MAIPSKKHILQRVIVTMGRILTKGAMRLWRQRNSTAVQLYATMAHLPPEVLTTLPILPHAEENVSLTHNNVMRMRALLRNFWG